MRRFTLALGKHFNNSPNVPNLINKGCQCISKILFLNMHELHSSGMCLVSLPGTFTRRK